MGGQWTHRDMPAQCFKIMSQRILSIELHGHTKDGSLKWRSTSLKPKGDMSSLLPSNSSTNQWTNWASPNDLDLSAFLNIEQKHYSDMFSGRYFATISRSSGAASSVF